MTDQPTALDLPMVDPLPEATQKYFDVCMDKLGMVPNVLKAHAFDIDAIISLIRFESTDGVSKSSQYLVAQLCQSASLCITARLLVQLIEPMENARYVDNW